MIQFTASSITSFEECRALLRELFADECIAKFSPEKEEQVAHSLRRAIERSEDYVVIGIGKEQKPVAVFSFLVIREEKYLEMIVGLSREKGAYIKMLDVLKTKFPGYQVDFVLRPDNTPLYDCLTQSGAVFEKEQQKMVFGGTAPAVDSSQIRLLTEQDIPSYIEMHNRDLYWTGEKILEAKERFRTFVAVEENRVVGYLDVTCDEEENEPFDLLVKESCRRKGYGRQLLAKALEMNAPKAMMLLVNIDNTPAIRLYQSMGFQTVENQNSIVAHISL